MRMKQWPHDKFVKLVEKNGFRWSRNNGHDIYVNNKGRHISIPHKLASVIARRLIKENDLNTDLI